jgi:hypothetical protein
MFHFRQSNAVRRMLRAILFTVCALGFAGTALAGPEVLVYKSPYCGCCDKWVEHMDAAGFSVEARETSDMNAIKAQFGVPSNMTSCHTAVVDGRFLVEGHVPAAQVRRMLEADGDPVALAVPGMPAGSPGMESPNPVRYDVIAVGPDGEARVYETVEGRSEPR